MSVAVIGCGRSGTNMVLEILRGNTFFVASKEPENKTLFKQIQLYPNNYLTKCDTTYFTICEFNTILERNLDLQIIWTIRDPRDMILSKIRRGQPKALGGDCRRVAEDATPIGCLADMEHMFDCYKNAIEKYGNRVLLVKMEDVITSIEQETKKMCKFIGIEYDPMMCNFVDRIRVTVKKDRYNCLDKGQIGLWKNWATIYDGFFTTNQYPIDDMFSKAKYLIRYFDYN
jgi:hypothetical protein